MIDVENTAFGIGMEGVKVEFREVKALKPFQSPLATRWRKLVNLRAKPARREILNPLQGARRKFTGSSRSRLSEIPSRHAHKNQYPQDSPPARRFQFATHRLR